MIQRIHIATLVFGFIVLIEIAGLVGLVMTLAAPDAVAAQLGLSARATTLRAIILFVFSLVITLNGLIAVAGLLARQELLFVLGAISCAVLMIGSGMYQVASGLFQLQAPMSVALGGLYVASGALAFWLGRTTKVRRA